MSKKRALLLTITSIVTAFSINTFSMDKSSIETIEKRTKFKGPVLTKERLEEAKKWYITAITEDLERLYSDKNTIKSPSPIEARVYLLTWVLHSESAQKFINKTPHVKQASDFLDEEFGLPDRKNPYITAKGSGFANLTCRVIADLRSPKKSHFEPVQISPPIGNKHINNPFE